MRIGEEILTSSSLQSSDDTPASRTRSRLRADYMAALVLLRTPEHIERVNQNRTHMASARQQLRETLTTAALNIQDEIATNRLVLKQDLHHVVHGHLLQLLRQLPSI